MIDMRQGHRAGDIKSALILLLERDVWRFFVDADAKPFQLALNHPFVRQRLVHVEHDENKMARFGNRNDLPPATTAVLGTLNDTGQVDDLQRCAVVDDLTGHAGERRELVGGRLGVLPCQPAHQRTLADRGEANKSDAGNSSASDVEARTTAAAAAARRGEEFAFEFSEFCLELAEMVRRGFVFLSPGHLFGEE